MSNKSNSAEQLNAPSRSSLVAWLADPSNHEPRPKHVQVVETHISWVFLTDAYAYKLKKPVGFDYLDFRSPEARHAACRDEVRLNHRLAPSVYCGVVPVTVSESGSFALNGAGDPVDWVVKMRRLDDVRRCDHMLATSEIKAEHEDALVDVLRTFYEQAQATPHPPQEYHQKLVHHVQANRRELLQHCWDALRSTVKKIHSDQLLFLHRRREELLDRVCGGRIKDGHGDLRPEHVYFTSPPVVIDCIEFSEEFRTLDIADELAFLAMECDAIGHRHFGREVLSRCLHDLQDDPSKELLDFYRTYRACVRAKVAGERAEQANGDRRQQELDRVAHYLHLAERSCTGQARPYLIAVYGGIGTGKSTLARHLAETLGFELLSTDELRRSSLGTSAASARNREEKYSDHQRQQIYDQLFQQAGRWIDEGVSVVVDGSFQLVGAWQAMEKLFHHTRCQTLAVQCTCADHIARERVMLRRIVGDDASEATPDLLKSVRRPHVVPPEDIPQMRLVTTCPIDSLEECVARRLATY